MNSSAFLKRFPRPARSSASPFKVLATMRSSSSIDLNFVSGFLTVFAIIMIAGYLHGLSALKTLLTRLLARHLHNSDLLLRQSVQPGSRRSASPWPRCVVAGQFFREAWLFRGAVYARRASSPPGGPCGRGGRHRRGRIERICNC